MSDEGISKPPMWLYASHHSFADKFAFLLPKGDFVSTESKICFTDSNSPGHCLFRSYFAKYFKKTSTN
jgi:hypothetical protein